MSAPEGLTTLPLPADFQRRSPIHRKLRASDAVFGEVAGAAIPVRYRDDGEEEAAKELGIADLSPLPRLGFKGRAVLSDMNTRGVTLDFRPNRAFRQKDGTLAAVLAMTEVLLLSSLDGEASMLEKLDADWSVETAEGAYLVPRRDSHFWFVITGRHAPSMFAKICAVDLRAKSFSNLAIAQTSIARSNAIVIRDDRGETLSYHLLGDSASAGYMWDCLLDAMAEWRGRPVGLNALG
ncbi:MAG: sarcosine oxidase [Alphaproteobacteria bacterium]|nr:sarcosine oxidase [Alphaproteobacteria bacterium]